MTSPEDPGGAGDHIVLLAGDQDRPGRRGLVRLARHALSALGVPAGAELSISLVDAERMAELNERAFGERAPTDVLSFPVDDPADPAPGPVVLGDVVICSEVAERQARALGRRVDEELALLLVHGILHLVGRDHADPDAERSMAVEQRRILEGFGAAVAPRSTEAS